MSIGSIMYYLSGEAEYKIASHAETQYVARICLLRRRLAQQIIT